MNNNRKYPYRLAVCALALCCGWAVVTPATAQPLPGFPGLSAEVPHNFDCPPPTVPESPSAAQKKRLLDILSWKSFIAVTWPGSYHGTLWQPKATMALNGDARLRWESWRQTVEVLKKDGSRPAMRRPFSPVYRLESFGIDQGGDREDDPLWDQNGEKVYYETRVNQDWVTFVVGEGLYHKQGQKNSQTIVHFPYGQCRGIEGARELRLAWKIMGTGDRRERFYRKTVLVPDKDEAVEVGLVGLHISHKTRLHARWIWSTFEHKDNVRGHTLEDGSRSKPSFQNPDCAGCPQNTKPTRANGLCDADGVCRTQVTATHPIASDTEALNTQVRQLLTEQGSVWQHYELIGTQFEANFEEKPTPEFLRNSVMETYVTDVQGNNPPSCIGCHLKARLAGNKEKEADLSFLLGKAKKARLAH